ncbi:GNAT family acetyltransferase [Halosimplex carlsbadense 2-9-1]|uniref:GNAT family acetyltransferase n=1 Tax=Halosimplex carlsbadense 2-9-1 TaxID=797114 RepID=M0CK19_9EURY|nr:GNAT family N-acetyltransferase [Halosimplex carlsbadense]ELZ23625.1 GNAT family acetyltransferase [Halosimplex carlsbadense 2-9-1]
MSVDVRVADDEADREAALSVRREVFIDEQGVPEDIEMDGRDDEAVHFVATDDGDPVGAARLREVEAGVGKVERVAVVADRRGEGLGRALMQRLEATAADSGIDRLVMHAQTHVEEFYERLGYETTSDVFEEAGIDHVEMEKGI